MVESKNAEVVMATCLRLVLFVSSFAQATCEIMFF